MPNNAPARFRKKPVEIQAAQWTGDNTSEVIDWVLATGSRAARWHEAADLDTAAEERRPQGEHIAIDTLEGTMRASLGDWIIRGIQGEFYPCKPDIFAESYDVAPEPLELTPAEQAAKAKHPHMSTCHDQDCQECVREIAANRRTIKAVRPVIEADARADERRKAGAATEAAVALLADLVVKCTEYGTQDGGFVANYLLPTGPVHRAIPWLENRGVIVRPGFDGREPVAAASNPTDTEQNHG